ncbi:MAG TPA: hypothetical protein PKW95_03155 [bacterium]|nr:hypothetical protein [bacterium]
MKQWRIYLLIVLLLALVLAACGDDDPSTGSGQADDDDHTTDDDASADDDMISDDDSTIDDDTDDDTGEDDDTIDDDDTEDDDDDTVVAPTNVQVWAVGGYDQGAILHYANGEVTQDVTPANLPPVNRISLASATHGLAATGRNLLVYNGTSWQFDEQFASLPEDSYFCDVLSTSSGDWVSIYNYSQNVKEIYTRSGGAWEWTDTSTLPDAPVQLLANDGEQVHAFGGTAYPPLVNYSADYQAATNSWIQQQIFLSVSGYQELGDVDYFGSNFGLIGGGASDPPLAGEGFLFAYNGDNWQKVTLSYEYIPSSTELFTSISIYGDRRAYIAGIAHMIPFTYFCFMVKYDNGVWSPAGEVSFNGIVQKVRAVAEDEYWYVGYYLGGSGTSPDRAVFRYCLDHECYNLLTSEQMEALEQLNDLVVLPVAE